VAILRWLAQTKGDALLDLDGLPILGRLDGGPVIVNRSRVPEGAVGADLKRDNSLKPSEVWLFGPAFDSRHVLTLSSPGLPDGQHT
jgi:hypothetical protein